MLRKITSPIIILFLLFLIVADIALFMLRLNTEFIVALTITSIVLVILILHIIAFLFFRKDLFARFLKYGLSYDEANNIYTRYAQIINFMSGYKYSPEEIVDSLILIWQVTVPGIINQKKVQLVELIMHGLNQNLEPIAIQNPNIHNQYILGYIIGYVKDALEHCSYETRNDLNPTALYLAIYICIFGERGVHLLQDARFLSSNSVEYVKGLRQGKLDCSKSLKNSDLNNYLSEL